jgi:hypothetical protein
MKQNPFSFHHLAADDEKKERLKKPIKKEKFDNYFMKTSKLQTSMGLINSDQMPMPGTKMSRNSLTLHCIHRFHVLMDSPNGFSILKSLIFTPDICSTRPIRFST